MKKLNFSPSPLGREGGFALLITLLVVLLLVVLVFELDFQARTDLRAAGNFRDDSAAYYLALSGIAAGQAILKDDKEGKTNPDSGKWDYEQEYWAFPIPSLPVGEGTVSGQIKDETGKFNLNGLIAKDNTGKQETVVSWKKGQLKRLFDLLHFESEELSLSIIDSIIDWIDANDRPEDYGAEDETYRSLDPPYSAKNGPLDTLEELLFIKGITPEIYTTILPYLTVYPKDTGSTTDPNKVNASFGKINVNTADILILQSMDEEGRMTEEDAQKIIDNRPYTKETLINGLKTQLGTVVGDRITGEGRGESFVVVSDIFSIESHGTVRATEKHIRAVWDRQKKKLLYFKVE